MRGEEMQSWELPAKVRSIQMLRGIAVLLVLVYHIAGYERKASPESIIGSLFEVGASGVDIFFVISGFVMVFISSRRVAEEGQPLRFLARRAVRIYPLYWFFTIVALVVLAVRPDLANRSGGVGEVSVLHSILLWPSHSAPHVGQGWTLIHEMYFYLGFSLILFDSRRRRTWWLAIWAAIVAFVAYGWKPEFVGTSPLLQLIFHPMTLEFLAGCGIGIIAGRLQFKHALLVFVLGIISLLIAGFLSASWAGHPHRVLLFGVPAVLLVWGFVGIEGAGRLPSSRFLEALGDASYSIYLCHIFVLSACLLVYRAVSFSGLLGQACLILGMFVISIIGGFLCHRWIEKPLGSMGAALLKRIGI